MKIQKEITKAGFTLIEILVAATILIIATASIALSFKGGTTSWVKGTARMERYLNARAALDIMSREIQGAVNNFSTNIDFFIGTHVPFGSIQDDTLYFVSNINITNSSASASDEYDLCEIGYELDVANSTLERLVDTIPDATIATDGIRSILVDNVLSLNFEYGYFNNDEGSFIFTTNGSWNSALDNYPNNYYRGTNANSGGSNKNPDGLPNAVQITLITQDEKKQEDPLTFLTVVYLSMSEER